MECLVLGHLGLSSKGTLLEDMIASEHPAYAEALLSSHHELLAGDGPLPDHIRHYIAIIAASRHQCSYLVEDQRAAFLNRGGPSEWLQGIEFAPQKLQALHTTNKILAHRPWLFDKSHIEYLLKNSWSLSELTHVVCILTHFHALCSLVFGTGIEAENEGVSSQPPNIVQECTSGSPNSQELSEGGLDILLERMKKISHSKPDGCILMEEQTNQTFEQLKTQTSVVSGSDIAVIDQKFLHRYTHLSPDPEYKHVKISRGKENPPTLKYKDCSWEQHGFSLMSDLYRELGDILDHKFKTAYGMTDYTCGTAMHVDTYPFRRSVWNYLHCLYGIKHDHYDYRHVNRLLDTSLKTFLKMVGCCPEKIRPSEYTPQLIKNFRHSEKLHMIILVFEARLQAELLYALRAIGRYLL